MLCSDEHQLHPHVWTAINRVVQRSSPHSPARGGDLLVDQPEPLRACLFASSSVFTCSHTSMSIRVASHGEKRHSGLDPLALSSAASALLSGPTTAPSTIPASGSNGVEASILAKPHPSERPDTRAGSVRVVITGSASKSLRMTMPHCEHFPPPIKRTTLHIVLLLWFPKGRKRSTISILNTPS
jgi:hypothetical protein